ncbi:FAD/NAD(P)-binding domain-containing protein [Cadophora sp. DSE1049]|nr:FAD/NAD(P)-binding domain-containing protein [Cadophora sp. DSE1049]
MSEPLHVLIIGAGITGLLVAQGLKTVGIKYSIFDEEASPEIRKREWTLNLHSASSDLKKLLTPGLYSRLREAYTDPNHIWKELEYTPWYNSKTGEVIHRVPRTDTINISRRRMRKLCGEGIEVNFGKSLLDVSYEGNKVTGHFADGSSVQGDLLIGADGVRSVVREKLLGVEKAKATPCHGNFTTTIAKYADAETALRVRSGDWEACIGYHPDGMFSNVPDSNDPTTWEFNIANSVLSEAPQNMDNASRLQSVRQRCENMAEPFRSSFMDLPDSTRIFNDKLYYWMPVPWDNHGGKVTLAGDAAHPMPPFRGQGLGQSIRDAANLVELLKKLVSLTEAKLSTIIDEYEKEMIERGKQEVELSLIAMSIGHDWDKLMEHPTIKLAGKKISDVKEEILCN